MNKSDLCYLIKFVLAFYIFNVFFKLSEAWSVSTPILRGLRSPEVADAASTARYGNRS